jgi:hypothetical protein
MIRMDTDGSYQGTALAVPKRAPLKRNRERSERATHPYRTFPLTTIIDAAGIS